ncbi:hypothetical protein GIB67_012154 [Kingdonia uniflora]|uniref:Uncharacterized protein n=1 Tax=Kingdonia uniflora TaxID=39325 RepID=A0A7J7N9E9_9MAGN|nr:hypothetical protein GIB67_012154 [Kingdonia uniflora]
MFERRTKAESWDQGGLVPRVVKHLEYLMTHYGEYDMEGGDKNKWVSISSIGARWFFSPYHFVASYVATYSGIIHPVSNDTHWASPPYVVDPPPLQKGRGRPRKERRKGDNEVNKEQKNVGNVVLLATIKKLVKQSDVTQVQTTPIVGGVQTTPITGGRGSSGRASNAGRGRGRSEGSSSGRASNSGRGRGRSEGASSLSNSGRGRGRSESASKVYPMLVEGGEKL